MAIRVGFIGASPGGSWASRSHIPYFNSSRATELGSYKITSLQNSSLASAEKAAKAFSLADVTIHDDPKSLAQDSTVDLVAISVKVPLHLDAILPALDAGKDIFVEWPLARNLDEAERVTALAREKGIKTLVGLQARQSPSVIVAKKMVEAGDLGEILGTTIHGYAGLHGETVTTDLVYTAPIENGANPLTIPFGHTVDALCWILGELDSLQATLANRRPELDVVDKDGTFLRKESKTSHDFIAMNGTLQRGGGVVNVVYQGGSNPTGGPGLRWQIDGTKGSLLLEGAMGHVQISQPSIKFAKHGEKDLKDIEGVKWVGVDPAYAVGQAWEALAGTGDGNVTTWEDALVRHRMIDAIYRSNEKGTREKYV